MSLQVEFVWLSDRQLQLHLSGFADKQKLHNITLTDAVDLDGYQILGGLWFVTAAANAIGYIDLETYESQLISEIKDQRFEIKPMPSVGDYLILDNSRHQYIYSLVENRITSTYPLKDLYKNRDTGWLDTQRTIFFEWENKLFQHDQNWRPNR